MSSFFGKKGEAYFEPFESGEEMGALIKGESGRASVRMSIEQAEVALDRLKGALQRAEDERATVKAWAERHYGSSE